MKNQQHDQSTTLAPENPTWQSLCIDVLEAYALDDDDGLKECVKAICEELRAAQKPINTFAIVPAQSYQAPAVELLVDATPKPDLNPTETIPAKPRPKALDPDAPDGFKTKAGAAGAAALKVWRERKKAEAQGAAAGVVSGAAPSEPTQEAQNTPEDTPTAVAPSNGSSPVAVLGSLQARQDAAVAEIRSILDAGNHMTPAAEKELARKHGLSLIGTQHLVVDTTRAWMNAQPKPKKAVSV